MGTKVACAPIVVETIYTRVTQGVCTGALPTVVSSFTTATYIQASSSVTVAAEGTMGRECNCCLVTYAPRALEQPRHDTGTMRHISLAVAASSYTHAHQPICGLGLVGGSRTWLSRCFRLQDRMHECRRQGQHRLLAVINGN